MQYIYICMLMYATTVISRFKDMLVFIKYKVFMNERDINELVIVDLAKLIVIKSY